MKNFTKSIFAIAALVAIGSFATAQNNLTYEAGQTGWTWTVTSGGSETFSEATNPATGGINTSATCGKLVIPLSAPNWALAWTPTSNLMGGPGSFILTSTTAKMKIMVYSSVISEWIIKFEHPNAIDGNHALNIEVRATNTKINEWEELNIDASAKVNGAALSKLVILPVLGIATRTQPITVYWDNLTFGGNATSLISTEAAGVKLFPNPASNNVTVVATSELSEVKISNLLGQTVKTVSLSGLEDTIALEGVVAGQYIVSVKSADGTVSTQKLVKK